MAVWKQFADRGKNLMTMLISKVGDELLSWHMTDYILDEIMSNPEGRKMMRKKQESYSLAYLTLMEVQSNEYTHTK